MKTIRLYEENSLLRSFTATVLACTPCEGGFAVSLDRTAFYPGGGGQACDTGTLGHGRVVQVYEENDTIVHLCDHALTVGDTVEGTLDWELRFDRMQQHTGEHMLCGVLHRMYGCHNVGFHMGAETVTVDFDKLFTMEQLLAAEKEANRLVWENLPVKCFVPSPEELETVTYRTKRKLPWPVRIVDIPGADTCACCGSHVAETGQVGLIKVFSCMKFHEGTRTEIACGRRALALLSRAYEENRRVSQAFSAKINETGMAAEKMNEALAAEKFRSAGLEKRLLEAMAAAYTGKGNTVHFAQGLTPAAVRTLAEEIAKACGGYGAVFSGNDGSYDMCLAGPGDIKALGQALCQACNGRGGGKNGVFQGRVQCTREAITAFFS